MAKYLNDTGLSYLWEKIKSLFVPQTRTINGKELSSDVTLSAEDVDALPSGTVIPITFVENTDITNKTTLRSFDSGTYVLKGYFTAYDGSSASYTFSTGMLVSIVKQTSTSYIQIFYAKSNTIQYLEISDSDVTRNDAKLSSMESTANKVTAIDSTSDDYHYPSAKAIYDATKDKLDISGGTMTGALVLSGEPTEDLHASTKSYVDSIVSSMQTTAITDTDGYFTTDTVEGALAEIGGKLDTYATVDSYGKVTANQSSSRIVSVTSAKTLSASDAGTMQYCKNTSSTTITIPKDVFDVGTEIEIVRYGTGAVTILSRSGVYLNGTSAGTVTMGDQYSVVALKCLEANKWLISGGMA